MSRQARHEPQWSSSAASGSSSGGGEDAAEEQPRAELPADQIGVLALPAEPGGLGERLFHDRRGVDEHFDVAAAPGGDLAGQFLELALDDVVIVAVLRIDGDRGAALVGKRGERVRLRPVIHAEHDDRADLRPQRARAAAPRRRLLQPSHAAVLACFDEGRKPRRRQRDRTGRCDRDAIEAQPLCLAIDEIAQVFFRDARSRGPHNATPASGRARGRRATDGRTAATSAANTSRAPTDIRSSRSRRDSRGSKSWRPRRGRHR